MLGTNFQNSYLNEAKFFGPYKDLLDCKEVNLEWLRQPISTNVNGGKTSLIKSQLKLFGNI
jgi:hypothetical protein